MIQEALFEMPAPTTQDCIQLPPQPPKPVIQAEPLGPCCKCGSADGVLKSPSGSIYCAKCGKCGGKTVEMTALGVEVKICGKSVEQFVWSERRGIWVCSCMPQMV